MTFKDTYLGEQKITHEAKSVEGRITTIEQEKYYMVENYDRMAPFLMNIVSATDHWMFISSTGGVTAGRKNADHAVFPYYTDDKIHESAGTAGSKIIFRIEHETKVVIWEPFLQNYIQPYRINRNLYKSITGNRIIFEEINHDLHLRIRLQWMSSEAFGWIKHISISNLSSKIQQISLLDGISNILPFGIQKNVQEQFSTLMDAYKRSELENETGVGIFSLSSIPVDRAEPSESLKATTVWNTAEKIKNILLSTDQLDDFRNNQPLETETDKKGIRGAYFIEKEIVLKPEASHAHMLIVEVDQDSTNVHNLINAIANSELKGIAVKKDIEVGTKSLNEMVSRADGIQDCNDESNAARHFSNVLFNIMRGGIYANGYIVKKNDLLNHIKTFNYQVFDRNKKWLGSLKNEEIYSTLIEKAYRKNDPDLQRILTEFLPLTFSRRHGDPSRPWNRFSINVRSSNSSKSLAYEGNWRDIFQNWEALSWSYPFFLEGILARFLNASTIDGYNPYRISSNGIDWETFDPENPWSFIGYWGDHQIIYLLKLLELLEKFQPGKFNELLDRQIFTFSNVPYRIKSYKDILKNPNKTIDFEEKLHKSLLSRSQVIGADGKLVLDNEGNIVHTSMMDKLLITLLTKLSNFIPGAGIWLNTQRPEWNDANNALVGNGVSMVTLYHIRSFTSFLDKALGSHKKKTITISSATKKFLKDIDHVFKSVSGESNETDKSRKEICDQLGLAGASYREIVYRNPNKSKTDIKLSKIREFLQNVNRLIDITIKENRRNDHLYHAYNLIEFSNDAISVKRLPLMLEGQVAVLSSGILTTAEVIQLLSSLRKSDLYREDQQSYMLYPAKNLKGFLEKNNISKSRLSNLPTFIKILNQGGLNILSRDNSGNVHFNGDFKNVSILKERIKDINKQKKINITGKEKKELTDIYESLFNHKEFTGRSGSFYKYEGLGCIYWHMVSKLLLAVSENIQSAKNNECNQTDIDKLFHFFQEIKKGIGVHKNPAEYGAIPTDPYSHTPSMMGAQQPGMTGQVKEDIITRWFELGISIEKGKIIMHPEMVNRSEYDDKDELSFSFCGTPIRYLPGKTKKIVVSTTGGEKIAFSDAINNEFSELVFSRSGKIKEISVMFKP